MKQRLDLSVGVRFIFVSLAFSMLTTGCSSPQSVGIRIGGPEEPSYRVVHTHPGPPPHAPAHGYRKKVVYYYYPTANAYYDQSRGVYFYLSGTEWQMAVSLPSSIRINVQERISLELETDRPAVRVQRPTYQTGQI
jgi:hypothetical protein